MSPRRISSGRAAGALRAFVVLGLVAITFNTRAESVGSAGLRALLSDRDIYLDLTVRHAPGWSTAQWHFRLDGSLTGYLFSSAYIGMHMPRNGVDNGNWWVSDNKLCIQWSVWGGGEQHCYAVAAEGDSYRASGESGLLAGAFSVIK